MRNPEDFGRPNYGAMAGAVVGGIGGLFALGLIPAIITRDIHWVVDLRTANVLGWVVSVPLGWVFGSLIGRPLGNKFRSERFEIAGGIVGGLLIIGVVAAFGYYLATRHS